MNRSYPVFKTVSSLLAVIYIVYQKERLESVFFFHFFALPAKI